MPTYTDADFRAIAKAVGRKPQEIIRHEPAFEAAARWYRLDRQGRRRTAPSKMRNKLKRISSAAQQLLDRLGVCNPDEAVDGPGDHELIDALVLDGDLSDDRVVGATGRIGRFLEIIDVIEAAHELRHRAEAGAVEIMELGRLTVAPGNPGNIAFNNWIGAMMELYATVTGDRSATSVGGPGQANEGVAGGPLIRFLQAAGKPLRDEFPDDGIELSEDALRSRVRARLQSFPA